MFKSIFSERYDGDPDLEISHVFLPFLPFIYLYVWIKFYRNGCFDIEEESGRPYYSLFLN
tara:strand:+ start:100 stop:279 length:180 start_codon:yes stop_codon:yes gene_type:complete